MQFHRLAGHSIRRLHQISVQVFQAHMREAGFDLTPVQFAALDAIAANPGIDQARVAALIAYDRATIGGVIDRLVQKGHVERIVSGRDRRARELSLTAAGRRIHAKALPVVTACQDAILARLSPQERERFLCLVRKAAGSPDALTPDEGSPVDIRDQI